MTLSRRQARWAELLSEYDFRIIFKAGISNKTDALSRRPGYRPEEGGADAKQPVQRLMDPLKHRIETESSQNTHGGSLVAALRARPVRKYDPDFKIHVRRSGENDERWKEIRDNPPKDHETLDGLPYYEGRLVIPDDDELKLLIAQNDHDSKIAGHFGQDKTEELVSRNFHWSGLHEWIRRYVSTCAHCQRNKSTRHKRYGLLDPLELPARAWDAISMDFITELPESHGNTQIWVVVDRFTKMAHFIPLPTKVSADDLSKVFLRDIWRQHGLPSSIVSDRDSRFTSRFWKALMALLEIKTKMSTAFHPQTDGQTERTNQTLEQYLRMYSNYERNDWAQLLPMAEFAYNNALASATGITPFYANYGYNPRGSWANDLTTTNPAAKLYQQHLHEIQEECLHQLKVVRENMGRYHDARRQTAPQFAVGSLVLLDGRNIKTRRPAKKLEPKYYGPYTIKRKVSPTAYELNLPPRMRIHPVFHVGLLEPYRSNNIPGREEIRPEPEEIEGEDEWEVEDILGSFEQNDGTVMYHVKWKGYDLTDATNEPWENLTHCQDKLKEFHRRFPNYPKDARFRPTVRQE